MSEQKVTSIAKKLYYSLGTMFIIIAILVAAILLFVSFGKGPTWERGVTGIVLSILTFYLVWKALGEIRPVEATWLGIISGMTAWMVLGEISHQFGFAEIEDEVGMVMLVFVTIIAVMLWIKDILPWGFKVFTTSFLLNWWGHAVLLPQLFLAETLEAPVFYTTYFITGAIFLAAFVGLLIYIIRKPAYRAHLIYYGLWLYALLITGIEGVTRITERTFGH